MDKNIESKVYEIITNKKYNKSQPNLKKNIKSIIRSYIKKGSPIKLIGFWGVGRKERYNLEDLKTCKFLNEINLSLKKAYPLGIEFTFIFATKHGILNGFNKKVIKNYTKSMEVLFKKFNFKFMYLDKLWKKYNISFKRINQILRKKKKRLV